MLYRLGLLGAVGAAAIAYVNFAPADPTSVPGSGPVQGARLSSDRAPAERSGRASARALTRADPGHATELSRLNLADSMANLEQRAQGDPAFAYALATALATCDTAQVADETFTENAAQLVRPDDLEAAAATHNELFRPCHGLTSSTAEQRFDLITSAAARGVIEAQIDYRGLAAEFLSTEAALSRPGIMDTYKGNVVAFASAAAASGDPPALYNAFEVFDSPLFGAHDPIKAHAYLLAYGTVKGGSPQFQALVRSHAGSLGAKDLAAAQAYATQLGASSGKK
ncbi:hypothetical protein ACW7G5_06825 [Luteimonas sp. A501]